MSTKPSEKDVPPSGRDSQLEFAPHHIRAALDGLRFGEVSAIVQDGRVVQVERREKKRLTRGEH